MTLQIGVIGCGAIGQDHVRRMYQTLSGARVVAVTDSDAQQVGEVMARHGPDIEAFDSGPALIAAPQVQAVLVTSWGPTHEELVLAAIAQGKPVFCEKPLAVTAAGCLRIVQAEMAHGQRLVQVGFLRPYDAGYRALRQVIAHGPVRAAPMGPRPPPNALHAHAS